TSCTCAAIPRGAPRDRARVRAWSAGRPIPLPAADVADQGRRAALPTPARSAGYGSPVTSRVGRCMKTLVIIPTYLEAENIADVLRRVRAAAPHADVLVVDDSSPDGTADLARATGDEIGRV